MEIEDENVCHSFKMNTKLFIVLNNFKTLKIMQNVISYRKEMQVIIRKVKKNHKKLINLIHTTNEYL